MKPIYYNYKLEISPINIFINMKLHQQPKTRLTDNTYLAKRISIIKNLQHITNKLRFRRQTFFLALSYLDYIFSNSNLTHDMKPELVGLVSLIIAGKIM